MSQPECMQIINCGFNNTDCLFVSTMSLMKCDTA